MLIASTASKAKRNATLNILPSWFKARYFQHCLKVAASKVKDAAKESGRKPWQEIVKAFKTLGVDRDALDQLLGHPVTRLTDEELGRLRGIYNGIKTGDLDRASVFAPSTDQEPVGDVDAALSAGAETTAGAEADPAVAVEEQGVHPPKSERDKIGSRVHPAPQQGEACPDCKRTWEIHTDIGHAVGCKFRE